MQHPRPQLLGARLAELHPTQLTVGKREVALKREQWRGLDKKARTLALSSHWFPAILGPQNQFYVVDHHHFGLALQEEGVKTVSVLMLKDLSWLAPDAFWRVMDFHQWAHPYDGDGQRRDFGMIPGRLGELLDDPYRSLAGALRRAGGFAKDVTPFSEFLWADYLRAELPASLLAENFDKALSKAGKLARSQPARYLPGWCGQIALL